MARHELPWDEQAFARLERAVRAATPQLAADALAVAADMLAAAARVRRRTAALTAVALAPTVADAEAHVERLVAPGFVRRSGTDRLPDVHRYVRGIEYRLDHLAGDVARDRRRMDEVRPIERELAEVGGRGPAGQRRAASGRLVDRGVPHQRVRPAARRRRPGQRQAHPHPARRRYVVIRPARRSTVSMNSRTVSAITSATGRTASIRPAT